MEKIKINLENPIAFHPQIARALGGIEEAIFVQQLYYWCGKGKDKEWIYKTKKEWEKETALTARQQNRIVKRLKELKLVKTEIKTINNDTHVLHYQLDVTLLQKVIQRYDDQYDEKSYCQYDEKSYCSMTKGNTASMTKGKVLYNKSTENTVTENTSREFHLSGGAATPQDAKTPLPEEPKKSELESEILSPDEMLKKAMGQNINQLMEVFYESNPCFSGGGFFGRKNFRDDSQFLIEQYGLDGAIQRAKAAITLLGSSYAPQITNPSELRQKMLKLESYLVREQNMPGKIVIGSDFSKSN